MAKGPSVILVSTDQQRGDCIGADRRSVRTPALDRLCERGTRFANAITPHPMCQPARASILTGRLPYSHGVRDNGRNLDERFGVDGLGGMFAGAGYKTHFIGKAHFATHETFHPTGRAECYHSTADFPADWGGPYFGFESVELMLRPHHHCAWSEPPMTLHYENALNVDGRGDERWQRAKVRLQPATSHFQAWRSALEAPWHSTAWIGDRSQALIDQSGDRPLFAWISFPDPHPPFLAPKPWCDAYHPDEIDIAANPVFDLEQRPWWHRAFVESPVRRNLKRVHAQDGENWGQAEDLTESALRDITALYYGMIEAIDAELGRLIDALDAKGRLDETVVVFLSDHGEWLGDHGLLLKGPMLYDGLLRVPLVIAGPGMPKGVVVRDPVSTLDLRQTLADLCGLSVSADNGHSLLGAARGEEGRDFALNEWEVDPTRSGVELDLRTVKSRRYRLSVDLGSGAGELYDLDDDPDERTNRFDDPSMTAIRNEHLDMIRSRPDDMIPAALRVGWH